MLPRFLADIAVSCRIWAEWVEWVAGWDGGGLCRVGWSWLVVSSPRFFGLVLFDDWVLYPGWEWGGWVGETSAVDDSEDIVSSLGDECWIRWVGGDVKGLYWYWWLIVVGCVEDGVVRVGNDVSGSPPSLRYCPSSDWLRSSRPWLSEWEINECGGMFWLLLELGWVGCCLKAWDCWELELLKPSCPGANESWLWRDIVRSAFTGVDVWRFRNDIGSWSSGCGVCGWTMRKREDFLSGFL